MAMPMTTDPLVPLVQSADAGRFPFAGIWTPYNGHRVVISMAIDIVLVQLTNWNRQIEITFNIFIAACTLLLLIICIYQTLRSRRITVVVTIPATVIFFSFTQYENWLQAWQLVFILTLFGIVLALWGVTIDRPGFLPIGIAIIGAIIATFTSLSGLIIWIAMLPVFWLLGYRRLCDVAIWIAVMVAAIGAYLHNYSITVINGSTSLSIVETVRFGLAFIGAPLAALDQRDPSTSLAVLSAALGLVGLFANILIYWRLKRTLRPLAMWIGLVLFTFGAAAEIIVGRSGGGIVWAMISRYRTFATPFWIALLVITAATIEQVWLYAVTNRPVIHWILVSADLVLVIAICTLVTVGSRNGFSYSTTVLSTQVQYQECIVYFDACPAKLMKVFWGTDTHDRNAITYLETRKYALFRDLVPVHASDLSAMKLQPSRMTFAASSINGKYITTPGVMIVSPVAANVSVTLEGYAVDTDREALLGDVVISVDGNYDFPAVYGIPRPDIASYLQNAKYLNSGFTAELPRSLITEGKHSITFKLINANRATYSIAEQTIELNAVRQTITGLQDLSHLMTRVGTMQFSIDNVGTQDISGHVPQNVRVAAGTDVNIVGWAFDIGSHAPTSGIIAIVDGQTSISADYGHARSDVAKYFNDNAYENSGYSVDLPTGSLMKGKHLVSFAVLSADGSAYEIGGLPLQVDIV